MANKLAQLSALAKAAPGLNKRAARQSKAAQDIMLQAKVQKARPQAGAAQQLALQRASDAGQATQQQMATQQQQAGQMGQLGMQAREAEAAQRLGQRELRQQEKLQEKSELQSLRLTQQQLQSRKTVLQEDIDAAKSLQLYGIERDNRLKVATLKQAEDLNKLGGDVKNQLLDMRLAFEKTERDRKFSNVRQLADYTLASAKSQVELKKKLQGMKLQQERHVQLLQAAHAKIEQEIKQSYTKFKTKIDIDLQSHLANESAKLKREIARAQARASSTNAMISGAFTVGGAIAGGVIGTAAGGVGAAPGAAIGATAGSALGNVVTGAATK